MDASARRNSSPNDLALGLLWPWPWPLHLQNWIIHLSPELHDQPQFGEIQSISL